MSAVSDRSANETKIVDASSAQVKEKPASVLLSGVISLEQKSVLDNGWRIFSQKCSEGNSKVMETYTMARVNVEDEIWNDGRFFRLSVKLGGRDRAIGQLVVAWRTAQPFWKNGRSGIPRHRWVMEDLSDEIINADLAVEIDGEIFMRGANSSFSWLEETSARAKAAGKASAESRKGSQGTAQPKGGRGFVSGTLEKATKDSDDPNTTEHNRTEPNGTELEPNGRSEHNRTEPNGTELEPNGRSEHNRTETERNRTETEHTQTNKNRTDDPNTTEQEPNGTELSYSYSSKKRRIQNTEYRIQKKTKRFEEDEAPTKKGKRTSKLLPPASAVGSTKGPTDGTRVWDAFAESVKRHWGHTPSRSAKTASIAKQLVANVGVDTAIAIARYYPSRRDDYFVRRAHPFELILSSQSLLERELATNIKFTDDVVKDLVRKEKSEQYESFIERGLVQSNPLALTEDEVKLLGKG